MLRGNNMTKQLFEITLATEKKIEECIYNIRGQQVMLDSDIASFFKVETKALNRQMKRNISRFPGDFCFQLNSEEFRNLRCQNGTFNVSTNGRKYLPYVYTEHGIIALAGVLKSDTADKMSVEIARRFIQMRKFIVENGDMMTALAKLQDRQIEFESETNKRFEMILNHISKLDLPKEALFCAGQWYDAYEFLSNIITKAEKEIIIVDPYCDKKVFTYLKNKKQNTRTRLFRSCYSKLLEEEINIFESQYGKIETNLIDDVHDRFIIIDNSECYLLGTSFNSAGNKLFVVNKLNDFQTINSIIGHLEKI